MLALTLAVAFVGLVPTAVWAWTIAGTATIQNSLGVGTEAPARQVHVRGENAVFRMDRDRDGPAFMLVETALGNFNTVYKTFVVSTIASGVNNGSFVINDLGTAVSGSGTRRLTIANNGLIGNVETPAAALHIKNPSTGNSLRLDSNGGTPNFYVQNDGDLYAIGADLELRLTTTTAGGYSLGGIYSTLLANTTDGSDEEAFLALNGNTAILCSPGDNGLFNIIDQDNSGNYYKFGSSYLYLGTIADYTLAATNQNVGDQLMLTTTGDGMFFVTDSNNDTASPTWSYYWYDGGMATANIRMGLTTSSGNLYTSGSMTQNHAFDLAEAYWKSEDGIEAGDVVSIDPEAPNAVVLARAANERAVVGVVSTDPGLIMGGGAFSAEKLASLWGEEVGARFAKERVKIEKNLAATDAYIQKRVAKSAMMKSALAKGGKAADVAQAKADLAQEEQEIASALEVAALQSFCEEHLAKVALAGRVPVKVDASYGAIQIGDLLVASATPGHAMRSENPAPGTVVGKALEAYASGQGTIMMLVLSR